jgi:hypothetical protein
MVDKAIYQDLGGLSEEYWYSFEDVDICCRLIEKYGRYPFLVADAIIRHNFQGTRLAEELDPKNQEVWYKKWIKSGRLPDALGLQLSV